MSGVRVDRPTVAVVVVKSARHTDVANVSPARHIYTGGGHQREALSPPLGGGLPYVQNCIRMNNAA
jgi:hypothetical protein